MRHLSKIVQGAAFALLVVHEVKTRIETKKAAELYLAAHAEQAEAHEEERKALEAQISYLCHMLDQNEIAVDDFDLIALFYNQDV